MRFVDSTWYGRYLTIIYKNTLKTSVFVRLPKLSNVVSIQYLYGGKLRVTWYCNQASKPVGLNWTGMSQRTVALSFSVTVIAHVHIICFLYWFQSVYKFPSENMSLLWAFICILVWPIKKLHRLDSPFFVLY